MPEITETTFAESRNAWRAWLRKHHASKQEIWVVLNKKHVDEPCVSYDAAVAQRDETRKRRIREVVRRCAANVKPGM